MNILFTIFVLTPLSIGQTLCFASIFSMLGNLTYGITTGYYTDGKYAEMAGTIISIPIMIAVLIGLNILVCYLRFGKENIKKFIILETVISIARFPLMLVSCILVIVSLFRGFHIVPRKVPSMNDGFFHAARLYLFVSEKGENKYQKAASMAMSNTAKAPSSTATQTAQPKPTYSSATTKTEPQKKVDKGIFVKAIDKAIYDAIVYRCDDYLPYAQAGSVGWAFVKADVIFNHIVIHAKLNYSATRSYDDDYIVNDATRCRRNAAEKLQKAAAKTVQRVANEYAGYDGNWSIRVDIEVNVH